MRPRALHEIVGHSQLLAPDTPLRCSIERGQIHSMILWGPPGCGKTTLALLLAQHIDAQFYAVSAVLTGLPELRKIFTDAAQRFKQGTHTILFVDEVHRLNKIQQDVFLPYIENGSILFVGATTENPSFELNSALLSRCRVHVMSALLEQEIIQTLQRALEDNENGLGKYHLRLTSEQLSLIAQAADGDARRGLCFLEIIAELTVVNSHNEESNIDKLITQVLVGHTSNFDKNGDHFYNQISALHKSIRSSNPDAALYWFARMLDGGADPAYLARRLTRIAVEDIGLADPRALQLSMNAWDAFNRIGSPEGELALAQIVVYLASTAKSNAVYIAFKKAQDDVTQYKTQVVPMHLRNASTTLLKKLGYHKGYQYDHDYENGVALTQTGFPDAMGERVYYQPVAHGLEIKLKEKLDTLRARRIEAQRTDDSKKSA